MESNKREMEFKHFSHNHSLVFWQMTDTYYKIHCSGRKSAASGNVYVCVCGECSYYLHEHCFRAERSLKHPSHPLHPLSLVPSPTYPSGSFFCNSCRLSGDGFSYSCSECEFDIHVHCALSMPNLNPHSYPSPVSNPAPHYNQTYPPQIQASAYPTNPINPYPNLTPPNTTPPSQPPQNAPPHNYVPPANPTTKPEPKPATTIKHFSHPHVLKDMEIDPKNAKACSACECEISGAAYCCTETRQCNFSLHKTCFDSAREVRHKSHPKHPLTLLAASPYSDGFRCNACLKEGKGFTYTCATCSYDLHIDCVKWPEKMMRADHRHALTLYYSPSAAVVDHEANFSCDVCMDPVHEMAWVYHCRECDFATHVECVTSAVKRQNVGSAVHNALLDEDVRKSILELWD